MEKYYNVYYENGGNVTYKNIDEGYFEQGGFKNVKEGIVTVKKQVGIFKNQTRLVKVKGLIEFPTYVIEKDQKYYDVVTGEEVFNFEYHCQINKQDKLGFINMRGISSKILANELRNLTPSDVERYMHQFAKAKLNAKRIHETYLFEQEQLNTDENFVKEFQKKYNKMK